MRVPFLDSGPVFGTFSYDEWPIASDILHKLESTWFFVEFIYDSRVQLMVVDDEIANCRI